MAKSAMTKSGKGGGPQTEEGKKVTSRNTLKTGAYSNTLILPGEDEADFHQIEEQFVRDFDPRDMAEITMVRDLAVLAWKKIRLENVELRVTLHRLNQPPDYSEKQKTKSMGAYSGYWTDIFFGNLINSDATISIWEKIYNNF